MNLGIQGQTRKISSCFLILTNASALSPRMETSMCTGEKRHFESNVDGSMTFPPSIKRLTRWRLWKPVKRSGGDIVDIEKESAEVFVLHLLKLRGRQDPYGLCESIIARCMS